MQQKLPGIINFDFDETIQIPSRYSTFVSYRRTKRAAVVHYMISQPFIDTKTYCALAAMLYSLRLISATAGAGYMYGKRVR